MLQDCLVMGCKGTLPVQENHKGYKSVKWDNQREVNVFTKVFLKISSTLPALILPSITMPIVKLLLLLLLFLQEKECFGTSDISTTEFKHVAQLHDKYSLQWNFNSTHIIFRAQAQTQGYMSFGLSIKGGMYDSDIFVCTLKISH